MKISKFLILTLISIMLLVGTISCTFDKEEELLDCSLLENLKVVSVQSTVCGSTAGSIEVEAQVDDSFSGTVSFTINGADETTSPKFENLPAGTYEIAAFISNECVKTISVSVENEDGLNISVNVIPSDCGASNGRVDITANNATGTVSFSLNGVEQSGNSFSDLAPGTYQISAEDDANCLVSQEVKVFSDVEISDIQAIINSNCASSGCHGGSVSPNLTTAAQIQESASRIKVRTGNQSMPPSGSGNSLTNAEINNIACWVDDLN